MPRRATIHQVVQIGVEATPGTTPAGGADKRLLATSFEIQPTLEITPFRPRGFKFPTLAALGKEWAGGSISGQAAYNDLTYLLAGLIATPTPAQQGATTAYLSSFEPDTDGPDAVTTFYVQEGGSVRAHSINYAMVNQLGLTFNRDNVEVSGELIGRSFTDYISLTGSPSDIAEKPILPAHVSVYVDDSAAALGTTQLTHVLSAEFTLGNRFTPMWTLNRSEPSWADYVEGEPELSLTLTMEADGDGMDLLSNAQDGDEKFIRIEAQGDLIEDTYHYKLLIDMCGRISDFGGFSDEDGVYAVQWPFAGCHDATWGKALSVALTNSISSL